MNSNSMYAFYGSLRKGMINHEIYKHALEYQYSINLEGFKMYALENYPFAVKTFQPKDSIFVEIFRISNSEVEKSIHQLELSVGYHYDEVIVNTNAVGIYLFHQPENYTEVVGGDWVKFFGFR